MMQPMVVSHFQVQAALRKRSEVGERVPVSPDLGVTASESTITEDGIRLASGWTLGWEAVEEISASLNNCFVVGHGEPQKIMAFSEFTNRVYSLMPTAGAPTMLVSGIPMHRVKGTDPRRDTLEKIKAIKPITGHVLDTATGLGYTAIEAARRADHVSTIELDPAVLEIARQNPWSRDLFDNPRITQLIGDSFDVVAELEDETFSRIIHDPPAFSLAGDLYSGDFYAELHRVMQRGGRLFHYVGSPDSKSGRSITRGVSARLRAAGFSRVQGAPKAFGVIAYQ